VRVPDIICPEITCNIGNIGIFDMEIYPEGNII